LKTDREKLRGHIASHRGRKKGTAGKGQLKKVNVYQNPQAVQKKNEEGVFPLYMNPRKGEAPRFAERQGKLGRKHL